MAHHASRAGPLLPRYVAIDSAANDTAELNPRNVEAAAFVSEAPVTGLPVTAVGAAPGNFTPHRWPRVIKLCCKFSASTTVESSLTEGNVTPEIATDAFVRAADLLLLPPPLPEPPAPVAAASIAALRYRVMNTCQAVTTMCSDAIATAVTDEGLDAIEDGDAADSDDDDDDIDVDGVAANSRSGLSHAASSNVLCSTRV